MGDRNYRCSVCHQQGHNRLSHLGSRNASVAAPRAQETVRTREPSAASEAGQSPDSPPIEDLFAAFRERAESSRRHTTTRTIPVAESEDAWRRGLVGTRKDIANWFDEGRERNATHLLVMRDGIDYDIYPKFAFSVGEARSAVNANGVDMQRVMEVYRMRDDLRTQMSEPKAWNVE